MGRAHRIEAPGFYHVASRGNNRQDIFDDALRELFLFQLLLAGRAFDWYVYAYALMSNHYHLLLEVGDEGLARGMQRLNYFFARASNARFERINHCVGDRYWNGPLKDDAHLANSIRYILWNPVRAGVASDPFESAWTSARASAGLVRPPEVLDLNRLLALFHGTPIVAHEHVREFVMAGREQCLQPWPEQRVR